MRTTAILLATVVLIFSILGCSNSSTPTDQSLAQTDKGNARVQALGEGAADVCLYWDTHNTTLVPNQLLICKGDRVAIIIPNLPKMPPITKALVQNQNIDAVFAGKQYSEIILPSDDKTLKFMDYVDDCAMVVMFDFDEAPTGDVGLFSLSINGLPFVIDRTYDYQFIDVARKNPALRSSDAVILVDVATGEFFPNGIVVGSDDNVALLVFFIDETGVIQCDFDPTTATLFGAEESHADNFVESKVGGGRLGHLTDTHVMHYPYDGFSDCGIPVIHFEVADFLPDDNILQFNLHDQFPESFGVMKRNLDARRVEISFEDHWVWNQPIFGPLVE